MDDRWKPVLFLRPFKHVLDVAVLSLDSNTRYCRTMSTRELGFTLAFNGLDVVCSPSLTHEVLACDQPQCGSIEM